MIETYPTPGIRWFITTSVLAAALMSSLDSTIANVALPHIQGSVSASADEITWVLTSYIVAAAICTPLTGWLAGRFGRKRLMLWSVIGFAVTSGLCGVSTSLGEIVAFRLLQGVLGAALIPISQAILLDINPPERHGTAMAIWSVGTVLGPIIGPALGGWLTDNLSWRWVFFINLPIGAFALLGLSIFLSETKAATRVRLDMIGFVTLALAIGSLQLMLDRGQIKDWFNSPEICVELAAAIFFGYMFIVQMATGKDPFINLALFSDRNFVLSLLISFVFGLLLYSVLALLPPMLEKLMGYPVILTGLVTAPRGVGSLIAMAVAGQAMKWIDARLLIAIGFSFGAFSLYQMSGFSLGMNETPVVLSGFIQGVGTGLIFTPLATLAFGTLDARFRNEAAAMFTLIRNIGAAMGVSIFQAMTIRDAAIVHARMVEAVRPDNPVLARARPDFDFDAPLAVIRMNTEITHQASMVSYVGAFWILFLIVSATASLVLFMRSPRRRSADDVPVPVD